MDIHKVRTLYEIDEVPQIYPTLHIGIDSNTVTIVPQKKPLTKEKIMSDQQDLERGGDGVADSIAATAIIALVVLTLYIWLSGMPS